MILNKFGKIVVNKINELTIYNYVGIDIYCIMPNHIHLILIVGAGPCACPLSKKIDTSYMDLGSTQGSTPTTNPVLGEYVKRLKTLTTFIYIDHVKNDNWQPFQKRIWQRNYYEHIIRDEYDLNRIRQYIRDNPTNWHKDRNNLFQ